MRFGGLFRERSFYQSRAARGAYRGLRRGFAKAGLDVVVKTFYSPIPRLNGCEITRAPAARATAAVPSVEPSSMTTGSNSGAWRRSDATTSATDAASL